MKILLINSLFRLSDLHFPIGLGYVAAACRQAGHEVEIFDLNFQPYSFEDIQERIAQSKCHVIGLGGMITGYKFAKFLTIDIMNAFPRLPIIVGGSLALGIERLFLENSAADIVVTGEGERTLPEILNRMEKSESLKDLPGIWYKEGYDIIENPARPPIENLDELLIPAWDLFDMPRYLNPYSVYFGQERATDIIASRGCPFGCKFCSHAMGRKVRFRNPLKVADEMEALNKQFNVRGFVFCDETFSLNKKWAREICDEMLRRKFDFRWVCYSRVDAVDEDILKMMRQAGCIGVSYGFESGSQKMLDHMGKGTTVQQGIDAIRITHEQQMLVGGNYMIGYPGETRETAEETIRFLLNHKPEVYGLSFPLPLPGSELWNYSIKNGLIKNLDEYLGNIPPSFANAPYVNFTDIPTDELLAIREKIPRLKS